MKRLLLFTFASLFINFTAQAGVVSGVLLNDNDPYICKGY